jgi:hypothetical protein
LITEHHGITNGNFVAKFEHTPYIDSAIATNRKIAKPARLTTAELWGIVQDRPSSNVNAAKAQERCAKFVAHSRRNGSRDETKHMLSGADLSSFFLENREDLLGPMMQGRLEFTHG